MSNSGLFCFYPHYLESCRLPNAPRLSGLCASKFREGWGWRIYCCCNLSVLNVPHIFAACPNLASSMSEAHCKAESYSVLMRVGQVVVCKTPYIIYTKEFEDVVYTHNRLGIRRFLPHQMGFGGELKQ